MPGGQAPTAFRPPGDPFAGAGMRVWPTTMGRRLYSSSVLTLTVRASLPRLVGPLVDGRPGLGAMRRQAWSDPLPGGAPWFSRGLLPLGPAGCPRRAALLVAGPTATTPTMTRSTRRGRCPGPAPARRAVPSVIAGGSATGQALPPRRQRPAVTPGRPGMRTGQSQQPPRVGGAATATGGRRRRVPAGPAGRRTSGAVPLLPCCSSSRGWGMCTSISPARRRWRIRWSPRSSPVSSGPCPTPARR